MIETLVTKSKFAEALGVGRSAVSNWIDRGIISDAAIVGEGRRAKIRLEVAQDEVRQNRDIGQSFGNGIGTKTTQSNEATTTDPQPELPVQETLSEEETAPAKSQKVVTNSLEDQLKRAQLEQQLRINRKDGASIAKIAERRNTTATTKKVKSPQSFPKLGLVVGQN